MLCRYLYNKMTDAISENYATQELEANDVMFMDTTTFVNKSIPDASNDDEDSNIKPCIGMEFECIEKVKEFYNSFAKKNGFGVRVRSSKPKITVLVCCNEGQRKEKSCANEETVDNNATQMKRKCSTLRSGCQASLVVSRGTTESSWIIRSFNNVHNHVLLSPKSVSHMRCHKKMSVAAKNLVEKFSEEGLPTGKVAAIFNNGDSSFSNRDCWNHSRNLRTKNLDVGDAQAVFLYCKRKQLEDPNFFYSIQLDDDSRMANFFWVDARSRVAYQQFGDSITFDTTYKTNKYSMPFAPFTGVNNHYQSILFGCALIQDESEISFIWLFEKWLEAMGGKKPISIITDQDIAMGAAIKKVFPDTRHRLCLWHIRSKFPIKLAHIYHKKSVFKRDLKRCIRDSSSIQNFETEWQGLIDEYKLTDNGWLRDLYNIRESWIPIYNISTFFAGMNTTQRSESINAFFNSFVNARTTLQEFVMKFEKANESRLSAERKEDYESRHKFCILSTGSKLEEHAAFVYTRNIFGKFQDELREINKFTKQKIRRDGSRYVYQVSNCYDVRDAFTVDVDLDSKIANCTCQLYEFMGILCKHILVIFQAKGVVQIPDHFILQRWTKYANRGIEVCPAENNFDGQSTTTKFLRRMHAQQQASVLVDLAEESEELYKFIILELGNTCKSAIAMKTNVHLGDEIPVLQSNVNHTDISEQVNNEAPQLTIGDPHISQTKGRKKEGEKVSQNCRFKSGLEVSFNKSSVKRKTCQLCGELGHYRTTCKKKKLCD
ncbi:hypothetical protein RIF29_11092 [Crotalaria pallida]|uniref:Protein FAR1-RELATED SEQUENCE n=1 Tax=Crotalaria pallida TaxID=3830 RepID=A0AAN9IKB4_CROPI